MAEPSPTAAPAAPTPDAPAPEARHPGVSKLLEMLVNDPAVDGNREPETPPAPAPTPAAPKPAAAAPAPADTPIRGRQRPAPAAPVRPPLPTEPAAVAAPAPAPARAALEADLELQENERQALADAEYAERKLGPEYAGLGGKMKKFLKDHIAYTERPDFEPDSPEYREWLAANQPKLSPVQQRAIMEAQVTEKAQETARSQVGQVEHTLYVRDNEPAVKQEGDKIYGELADLALPQVIKDILAEPQYAKDSNAGWAEANKHYRLEVQTTHNVISAFKDDVEELQRISRRNPKNGQPMVAEAVLASDPKFAQHQRIRNLVADMCEDFKKSGEPQQKNGKWFATREEYQKIPEAQRSGFWTFSNADVIGRAKSKIPGVVANSIQRQLADQTARGFIRPPRQVTPPAPAPRPSNSTPPAPRPSAIPSASQPGAETQGSKLAAALSKR